MEPSEGQVFNSTNNVTFTCNASDEGQVLNMSLYHSLSGMLSLNQTEYYGELPYDSNTSFLCHFNGGLACQGGGSGSPVANDSLSSQPGKFSQGVHINETGLLRYQTSGNFDRNQGAMEFWIRPGSNVNDYMGYIFDAADIDADDENEMMIYFFYGTLRFWIWDSSGNEYYAAQDASSMQVGAWYHIAAAWDIDGNVTDDGDRMALYINGSMEESDYSGGDTISYSSTSSTFSIGSDKYSSAQINATIDDFRISSAVRGASEINESYQDGLANHSSVSKSWNLPNVPDGSYLWSCLAYDNDLNSNSSSASSLYVDMSTPPSVNGIFLYPNSSDDIDPGVTINFTANISDPSGVDSVIFQWKKVGDWSNITMAYNSTSGLYENASFQTGLVSGVYLYRIWSNDSGGRSGYSAIQNVTSAWDFTWMREPASFGTKSGLINSVGNVGMLTINNTGDDTLNFSVSSSWPLAVYYNGSDSSNFYVESHAAITINITAQFASSDSENDMTITINASHPTETPSPLSLTTNATMNSFSGGPYLSVSIMDYSAMVSQSQAFNLSARVKNIGNETASGVWLNWSLPAGWTSASGNATNLIGNLSPGSSSLSNLTITIDPSSASPGTFIIYANSSCEENASGYDSKTVGVSCSSSDGVCGYGCSYVNDDDCGIPQAGGGAPGTVYIGGGGETQYLMGIEAPSSFDIQRGDRKAVRVKITNQGLRTNLTAISLYISGHPLSFIGINPPLIAALAYNQSGFFDLEFFAPNYTRYGTHNITLTARGEGRAGASKNFTAVEKAARVSMVVHSVHENETRDMLAEAEEAVREMADAGLSTRETGSLLEQARSQMLQWDYDTGLETLKGVLELKERVFRISSLISHVEEGIKEAESFWIQAPESRKMASLSRSALQREDYAKAEERAGSAVAAFMIESQGLETARFAYANWHLILVGSALFAGAAFLAHRKTLRGRLRKRIALLSEEEKAIRKLMEKSQEEMYREKTLSGQEYHRLMSCYESRLAKIRERKSRLTGKLIKLQRREAALAGFRKQEQDMRKEIQGMQRKYFEQGSITKSSYAKDVAVLREELAESLRNIDSIMERRGPGKKGQAGFLAIAILLVICAASAGLASAQDAGKQAALDAMEKAEGWIDDMEQLGFPATRANDTLSEAQLLFSKGYYQAAESLANDVEGLKKRAISISSNIDRVEAFLYQAKSTGIDVSQPQALFEEALAAFRMEDYDRAEELLDQASSKLEELESDYSMKRVAEGVGLEGLTKKIQDNLLLVLITATILISAGIAVVRIRRKRKTRGRIGMLDKKADNLNSMMKELQLKYFEKGEMSESEYRSLMERYRRRLAGAKRRKLALEGLLNQKQSSRPKDS